MKLRAYDLERGEGRRIPSVGECIYCHRVPLPPGRLTDEHVVPFAIGANAIIFKEACCDACARTIQPYEQEVLLKQLGTFRRQIGAPSRTKRKRKATHAKIRFKEVDDTGADIRQLSDRNIAIDELPLALSLWALPEPGLMRPGTNPEDRRGKPWYHCDDRSKVETICRQVAEEEGAKNVAMEIGVVNRDHFLRFLAKTAHAYAMAELGPDSFVPVLEEIILLRAHDIANYVGGHFGPPLPGNAPENLVNAHIGEVLVGPARGMIAVALQFYPLLGSPVYSILVGRPKMPLDTHRFERGSDVTGQGRI